MVEQGDSYNNPIFIIEPMLSVYNGVYNSFKLIVQFFTTGLASLRDKLTIPIFNHEIY